MIVAGLGRCGTTIVAEAISNAMIGRIGYHFQNRLDELFPYGLQFPYKTHDLAPLECPMKAIYLFGDPRDIAVSTHIRLGNGLEKHYKSMRADHNESLKWVIKDTLRLTENFNSWARRHNYEVMMLRYDCIWEFPDSISEFVGKEVVLPERKQRLTNWRDHPEAFLINRTYGDLAKKIEDFPDCILTSWLRPV